MKKALMSTLVLVIATGCTFQRAQVANQAKSSLVGMTKADLLACAGAPARSDSAQDIEVLTYVGSGGSVASILKRRRCETSFALRNERVTKVTYAGNTGGLLTQDEQCAFVVQNCVQ